MQKAYQILNKTDIAVLVMDATLGMTPEDEAILKRIQAKEIPFLLVFNKTICLPVMRKSKIQTVTESLPHQILP